MPSYFEQKSFVRLTYPIGVSHTELLPGMHMKRMSGVSGILCLDAHDLVEEDGFLTGLTHETV